MCGIAGFLGDTLAPDRRLHRLHTMLAAISYRGPDEAGYFIDDRAALGAVRLRIVDLSSGTQPISDSTQRYWIVFNGEVYNHRAIRLELESLGFRFETQSDTEVTLYAWLAWGSRAFQRFNGPFAVAIYDRLAERLVLARDRFGKRPLYFLKGPKHFAFASEAKSFIGFGDAPLKFEPAHLASIYRNWTPVEHEHTFKGIFQLPAGTTLEIGEAVGTPVSYVGDESVAGAVLLTEEDAASSLRETLTESVKLRLASEVSYGVYLSGGLDSAIVAQLVKELGTEPVRCFSVSFEDQEYDESPEQYDVVNAIGVAHTSITVRDSDITQNFPLAVWHAEVPIFRSAAVPMYLLSAVVRDHGIKVVLTGEGADEVFLGYDLFKETLLRSMWSELSETERAVRLSSLYPFLRGFDHTAALHDYFARSAQSSEKDLFSHQLRHRLSVGSVRLLKDRYDDLATLRAVVAANRTEFDAMSVVEKAQWIEFQTLLCGYLLSTQGDRMAAAHGVENRCPFLDPAVVRLGRAVNLRFDSGYNEKFILKRAFERQLPPSVIRRPKRPFRAPDAATFLRGNPEYLELVYSQHELEKIEILDTSYALALAKKVRTKPIGALTPSENQAFMFLLSTVLLHQQYCTSSRSFPIRDMIFSRKVDSRTSMQRKQR